MRFVKTRKHCDKYGKLGLFQSDAHSVGSYTIVVTGEECRKKGMVVTDFPEAHDGKPSGTLYEDSRFESGNLV